MTTLERLVREWCDAQQAIDRLSVAKRQSDIEPLNRLIAAHNALLKYAESEIARAALDKDVSK
jgi:hypothetical protein